MLVVTAVPVMSYIFVVDVGSVVAVLVVAVVRATTFDPYPSFGL